MAIIAAGVVAIAGPKYGTTLVIIAKKPSNNA